MKPGDGILFAAAAAGIASFGLASISATIAAIASVYPPVYHYLTPAQNAQFSGSNGELPLAIFTMLLAALSLVHIILRRHYQDPKDARPTTPTSFWGMIVIVVCVALVMSLSIRAIALGIAAIRPDEPLTNSPSFRGLSLSFGTLSIMSVVLGQRLFALWLQRHASEAGPPISLRLAWRCGRAMRAFAGR
jgi:uncharacterized membrane protein YidH (DUF202 family)